MNMSIVIPMWNEENWVKQAYTQIKRFVGDNGIDTQIVFATDGCTDRTVEYIRQLQEKDASIIHFDNQEKLGRGLALKRIFDQIDTRYLIYMDSDLATDLKHLPEMISRLEDGADIVTGSRLMRGSKCVRTKKRHVLSRVYNFLTRLLLRSKLSDHQCGFKGFNREKVLSVLSEVKANGWFWDTEILVRAQKKGLIVTEFPVEWTDRDEESSKVNVWKDTKSLGTSLLELRFSFLPESLRQMFKFALVGISNTLITLFILWLLDTTIGRGMWGYYWAYAVGAVNSFVLNRSFTFQEKGVSRKTMLQLASFILTASFAMVLYSETSRFIEEQLGWFYLYAALGGIAVNFVFQFTTAKLAIFRGPKSVKSS